MRTRFPDLFSSSCPAGSPVVGQYVNIYYKNPSDENWAPLAGSDFFGHTPMDGVLLYDQNLDTSWFRDSEVMVKAVLYPEESVESNVVTLSVGGGEGGESSNGLHGMCSRLRHCLGRPEHLDVPRRPSGVNL